MSDQRDGAVRETSLCLYWYETKAEEQPRIWLGQLASAMLRLITVQREFETLGRQRDIESSLRRLELCLESYMLRAFEVRERVLGLLASRTNCKKTVDELRHPQKRREALLSLTTLEPELTPRVEALLVLLDHDVGLRNLHTHSLYLSLGLDVG